MNVASKIYAKPNNIDYLKRVIKQRLEDQSLQNWNSLVHNSPKAINYKTDFIVISLYHCYTLAL